jgi:hypothetical protein
VASPVIQAKVSVYLGLPITVLLTYLWTVMIRSSELFGPGHFVGLELRLKSEIRTRTRART